MQRFLRITVLALTLTFVGAGCASTSPYRSSGSRGMSFSNDWFKPGMWVTRRTSAYVQNLQGTGLNITNQTLTAVQFSVSGKSFDGIVVEGESNSGGKNLIFWPQGGWKPGTTPKFMNATEINFNGPNEVRCNTVSPLTVGDMNPNIFPGPLMNDAGSETITLSSGRSVATRRAQSTNGKKNVWLDTETPFFLTKLVAMNFAGQELGSSMIEAFDQGTSGGPGAFDFGLLRGGKECNKYGL